MADFLTALGTSAALPTKKRSCSSYFLQIGNERILIDCGEGAQRQLNSYVPNGFRINRIFISHSHADHILGLPGLLLSMSLNGRQKELKIHLPQMVKDWLIMQMEFFMVDLGFDLDLIAHDFNAKTLLWSGQHHDFYSLPLDHTTNCCGLFVVKRKILYKLHKHVVNEHNLSVNQILDLKKGKDVQLENGALIKADEATYNIAEKKILAFLTDTRVIKDYASLINGTYHLIHESTFCDDLESRASETGHSTARQSAEFALEAQVKNLYLTHISSRYQNIQQFESEARSIFPRTTVLNDGFKIPLTQTDDEE